jgi:divalent metal cation (Fe/Co/Zn/Cd) transporter
VTAAALIVMPILAITKRRTGQALGNRTLVADSAETAFCAFTSAAAPLGVGLNTWLGWWWADPAAALIIAALAGQRRHRMLAPRRRIVTSATAPTSGRTRTEQGR